MCGRYAITTPASALERLFGPLGRLLNLPAHYNAAPTQPLPVIRRDRKGDREMALARWGLIPSWSKGPDARFSMINARADTVANKPAYRGAFRHRRCLVPADGFFEWQAKGKQPKQPWYFTAVDDQPFAFAGLWEDWLGADGSEIDSFAIIVTEANDLVRPVHDRMPVILSAGDYATWLGEDEVPTRELQGLLRPFPAKNMKSWPVSRRVNSSANDDASLLEPVAESDTGEDGEAPSTGLLL